MYLKNLPISLLVAVSSLCSSSSALPFLWKRTPTTEVTAPRPTYSVVPIDGSGGQGGDADTTLTVTVTSAPTTIVESPPPVTETVTVSGKPATRTISVIDIQPTTEFVTTTLIATPTTSTSHTTLSIPPISTTRITSTIPTPSPSPSPSSPSTISSPYYTTSIRPTNATVTLSHPISTPAVTWTTSTSYDNGFWHTTYPAWNGTHTRRFDRRS
ncbi:hypothetical protein F5Y14DRAFT_414803 [Nemania sp. NC0429]|nr:hypothetical protein F5Y14DRAFT_414803 [Nemania sp. NC0429]